MHTARGSNTKLVILIIVLVLVIIALGFLCVRYVLNGGGFDFGRNKAPVSSLPTQVAAYDARGRDVTSSVSITEGTARPDDVPEDADVTLLDISWVGKKAANYPFIITVSNDAFPNNDGLSVYHNANGQWELLGTYLIENHSVSFQTNSLSPFAFQVISSNPEPTPTPEPTPEPTPTATPEPTPEPIDYGMYNTVQVGEFVQANAIALNGAYVIAFVDDPNAEAPVADSNGVTFFDVNQDAGPYEAKFLVNYDGTKLITIDGEVIKGADGRYTIANPVVDGMVWTAVTSDTVSGAERFSLVNNDKYLNLDDKNENVILNNDDVKTRWLYGAVVPERGDSFTALSYQMGSDSYFVKEMSMPDEETPNVDGSAAVEQKLSFTVTKESDKAMKLVIFQNTASATTNTNNNANGNGPLTGLFILTGTPSAVEGLDATPIPTEDAPEEDLPVPVTPTPPPGGNTNPTPTPNTNPGQVDPVPGGDSGSESGGESASGTDSSGGNSGGDSGGESGGTTVTPEPVIDDASDT